MKLLYCIISLCFFVSCNNVNNIVEIKNDKKGTLKSQKILKVVRKREFPLDSFSAPRPQFIQLYKDTAGNETLTVLSTYSKSIDVYDFKSTQFIKKISLQKTKIPLAFYIKNPDSIFVYDDKYLQLSLLNRNYDSVSGISLIENANIKDLSWVFKYPQYVPHSVNQITETSGNLFFIGQYIWSVPDTIVHKFKFLSLINENKNSVKFLHTYPDRLYGHHYLWDDPTFTSVYFSLVPQQNKIVYSFPVSHDLYIYDLGSDKYDSIYGGSNYANSIISMDGKLFSKKSVPREYIYQKACTTDLYGAILYDKHRNVYYRFLRKGIPEKGPRLRWENKQVSIIILDEKFNYLGETNIGDMNEYYPDNAFVSSEGLNIEYVDANDIEEKYLKFKTFSISGL